uniref:Uncharacterized protein n=1 Tax=Pyrodinium bahamense TaxID=73915 RepID=A0A7S0A022_9DINO
MHVQEARICGWSGQVHWGMWCTLIGPAVGLMFIFSSPAFPRFCGHDPVVFLDVACICQTDDTLKAAGIHALGGLLRRSRELHIMWSPEYFSRLWCVYELAAFLRINAGGGIRFRPIFIEVAILLYFVFNWLATVLFMACLMLDMSDLNMPLAAIAVGHLLLLHCMHLLRHYMRDKQELAKQLEAFDVRHAQCREGRDRAHILRSIQRWYGSEDHFNDQVRGQVRFELLQTLSATHLPYLTAFANGSGAAVCALLDCFVGLWRSGLPAPGLASFFVYATSSVLFLGPALARLFFFLAERFAAQRRGRLQDWGTTFLLFAAWEGCVVLFKGANMLAFRSHILNALGVFTGSSVFAWVVFHCVRIREHKPAPPATEENTVPVIAAGPPGAQHTVNSEPCLAVDASQSTRVAAQEPAGTCCRK